MTDINDMRLDLRDIQRDVAQLHQPRSLAGLEDLHKQLGQLQQMLIPKITERAEIRPLIRNQHLKGYLLLLFPGNLAQGRNSHGIHKQQYLDQQLRIIRVCASRCINCDHRDEPVMQQHRRAQAEQRMGPLETVATQEERVVPCEPDAVEPLAA